MKQQRHPLAWTVVCGLSAVGTALSSWTSVALAQESPKWSVPARILAAPQTTAPMPAGPARTARPVRPAAESGLPVQYETTRHNLSPDEPPATSGGVRFLVPLVDRPILVEALVTVDGRPFRMLRERRIDQLLDALSRPAVEVAAAAPPTSANSGSVESPTAKPQPADETDAPPATTTPAESPFVARLRRYAAATQHSLSRDELRWLIQNWADGPTLLVLDENYQRVRGSASPLFQVLDRDANGILAPDEIASAEAHLWKHDTNQDGILTFDELRKGAAQTTPPGATGSVAPPLVLVEQLAKPRTWQRLCNQYPSRLKQFDRDADGTISSTELAEIRQAPPDLIIHISFDAQDASRSQLEIRSDSPALGDTRPTVRASSVTFPCGATLLELSAIQSAVAADTDQISLGAVRDGFPLLPELDANEDGRLTIREVRQVPHLLRTLDRDGDGSVASAEVLPTLRLAVGLGPLVHRPLATVRSPGAANPATTGEPPDWFARMDRNHDGDLTRGEFLGGQDQFATLDADGDGLISILEAQASEKQGQ